MKNWLFYITIKDLTVKYSNQRAWLEFLEGNDGKKMVMEIYPEKGIRSLPQNSLYWLYLGLIEKETGNLATDLHELFKRKLLPPIPKKVLGVEFKVPSSTTDLSKTEFGEYLDKICAMTGIPIPDLEKAELPSYPEENYQPKF